MNNGWYPYKIRRHEFFNESFILKSKPNNDEKYSINSFKVFVSNYELNHDYKFRIFYHTEC